MPGYEADGWLGLLLGTSLWYALYGATLASESSFDDRLSALSREIGSRGRADAAAAAAGCDETIEAKPASSEALLAELEGMKLSALRRRAVSAGVSAEALDAADDAEVWRNCYDGLCWLSIG